MSMNVKKESQLVVNLSLLVVKVVDFHPLPVLTGNFEVTNVVYTAGLKL